jgi:hypothetical protein
LLSTKEPGSSLQIFAAKHIVTVLKLGSWLKAAFFDLLLHHFKLS